MGKRAAAAVSFGATFLASAVAAAATINVSPTDDYTKIEGAKAGDEVVIAPGTYKFRVHLTQQAPSSSPIIIRAQDPNNPPVWDLAGTLVENAPGSYTAGDRGRGCWQLSGATNIQISGLVIKNCVTASHNSAGMRYYNGTKGILVKDVVFRTNDNGLTGGTSDSEIVVEHCEFDGNGNLGASSSSPTHNIYIYGGTFTLRYSYGHDPIQGQNFHIRAKVGVIEYNWFAREKSYMGDLMTDDDLSSGATQDLMFRGNVVLQGNPNNKSQVIAVFNDNGVSGMTMNVHLLSNTFIIGFANSNIVHLSNADGTTMSAEISNNVVSGGKPYLIEDTGKGTASGQNNWFPTATVMGTLTGTLFGTNPFTNAGAKDFTLVSGCTGIGAAATGVTGAPNREYFQNETAARMYRVRATVKDVGAFETTTTGPGIGPYGTPPPPPDGGTTNDSGTPPGDSGTNPQNDGGTSGDGGSTPPGQEGGCGCHTTSSSGAVWVALLALFGVRRRRVR